VKTAIILLLLIILLGTSASAATPQCSPPAGYIEYVAFLRAPENPSKKCIETAQRYHSPFHFVFESGEFDFSGSEAESVSQETSKNKCDVVTGVSFGGDDVRFLAFRFDRNWYRGTGVLVDDGCSMPFRFVRDPS